MKKKEQNKKKIKLAIALLVFNPVLITYVVIYLCNVFYVAMNKKGRGLGNKQSSYTAQHGFLKQPITSFV